MGQPSVRSVFKFLANISRLKLSQFESLRTRQDIELPNTVVFIFVSIEVSCPGVQTDGLFLKSDSCTFIQNIYQDWLKIPFLCEMWSKRRGQ